METENAKLIKKNGEKSKNLTKILEKFEMDTNAYKMLILLHYLFQYYFIIILIYFLSLFCMVNNWN